MNFSQGFFNNLFGDVLSALELWVKIGDNLVKFRRRNVRYVTDNAIVAVSWNLEVLKAVVELVGKRV